MAAKFPTVRVFSLVTIILGLLLVAFYILSQHQPIRVADIFTGQQQVSRTKHVLPATFTYIHDRHLAEADWFLKADDDTYVIVDNLRFLLSHHDADRPLYFGHHFRKFGDQGYMSGGAGYVLSRAALKRLVVEGYRQEAPQCRRWGGAEDAALGRCLEGVGVRAGLSLDADDRQTFHPFNLLTHLSGSYPRWYYDYSKYKVTQGSDCCSDFSISFHFVEPNMMQIMDHLLYKTQIYGLHQGAPQRNVFRRPSGQ